MTVRNPEAFRQILSILVASITGVTFGTMLGWPSLMFPILVNPEITPIQITWDQSAMIAGFLMWGNIFGTSFSHIKFLGTKTGILCGFASQVAGWISMYFTVNIPELLLSRALVGIGNGFALGQIRMYVYQTCEPNLGKTLMQYFPLSINVGVIIVYCYGTFATFRSLSIWCGVIPALGFLMFAAIPKKPYTHPVETKESIETKKGDENESNNADPFLNQITFFAGFKDKKVRTAIFVLWCLIFIPQYSGGAANVVYNQVMHMAALNPYPKICGIIYAFVFLFSNFIALKYAHKFPRKPILIASCIISGLLLVSVCFYYYFLVDLLEVSQYFVWSPLILLSIFNFFHTFGVNTVPILYITDKFPLDARVIGNKFYVMYFSLSALLSTKVFQVCFTYFGMHMAYVFTSSVALGTGIIALIFFKESGESKMKSNLQGFENNFDEKEEVATNNIKEELKDTLKARYEIRDEIMNKQNKIEDLNAINLSKCNGAVNRFEVIETCPESPIVPHRNTYYNEVDLSDEISPCPVPTTSTAHFENDRNAKRGKTVTEQFKVIPQRKLFNNRVCSQDDIMTKF